MSIIKKNKDKIVMKDIMQETINTLEKKYGVGVVLQNDDTPTNVKAVSTGCYEIDSLLGCGGLPLGRIIEIYGQESSGKTTMCLFFAAQIQKNGGKVVYLDVEQSYDRKYAGSIGIDTDSKNFIVSQPSTLEETFDIIRAFIATNQVDLIIVDSVAAMIPKRDLEEGNLEKDSMAVKARLMSKYLPVITSEIAKSKTIVIFINQLRSNVGVFYGPKDTTPGGKALKFFASIRLSVTKGEAIKADDAQIGNTLKIVCKKSKVGFPFKECEVDLYYGSGIDLIMDTVNYGERIGTIHKEGNTYMFGDKKLGVGREQAKAALEKDTELYQKIRESISSYVNQKN